jgi:hypothetical protein
MDQEAFDLATEGLKPINQLDPRQRMVVAGYIHTEGFIILQRIMEDELRLLNQKLINTDGSNQQEVLFNHGLAKAAGMFYAGILQRIKEEVTLANSEASTIGTIQDPERPYYPTEFDGQEEY